MRGINKLVGGFLGFLLGGPLGALLGLLTGHAFDKLGADEGPTDHYTTRSELMKAYRSLEITSSATAEEIKCAYRRCMQRYHPDRLDRDLPPEQHKASTHKVQQIQKAYALLCQARNIQ